MPEVTPSPNAGPLEGHAEPRSDDGHEPQSDHRAGHDIDRRLEHRVDGRLPARVGLAVVLCAITGWLAARALVGVLAGISVPSLERTLMPARLDMTPPIEPWGGIALASGAAGLLGLGLPLLCNRTWWSRHMLSWHGAARLLLAAVALAWLGAAVSSGNEIFSMRTLGGGANDTGPSALALALRLALAACTGALFYGTCSEASPFGNPARLWTRGGARPALARALALGGVAGLTAALLTSALSSSTPLFYDALFSFLGEAAEPSRLGWQRLELGLTLGMSLLAASSGGLVVALAPSPAGKGPRSTALAIALLPAAALSYATTRLERYCLDEAGMRTPSFAAAAALEPAPRPRTLIMGSGANVRVFAYAMSADVLSMSTAQPVGATLANVERARRYVAEATPRWNAHTVHAWGARAAVADRLFEPEAAVVAQLDAAEETGSVLYTMLATARLPRMPSTEVTRAAIDRLLDRTRFRAGKKALPRLVPLALARGDLEQAHSLWREIDESDVAPAERTSEPLQLPRRDGRLAGTIGVPPGGRGATRLGVFWQKSLADTGKRPPLGWQLAAATSLDERGRFTVGDLPLGAYTLGVLVDIDPATAATWQSDKSLGPFELSTTKPQVDLGVVTLAPTTAAPPGLGDTAGTHGE